MDQLSRDELVNIVQRIIDADGVEEELDRLIVKLEKNVPHPYVSDLIFYPEKDDVTAEEIVEEAMSYKAIQL